MRTTLLVLLFALVAGCNNSGISPHLATDISLKRTGPTAVLITVHVKNLGSRGTVPIDVEVDTAPHQPAIHPAAFVLNHQEVRELSKSISASGAVHATLIVKEAERGRLVATKRANVD